MKIKKIVLLILAGFAITNANAKESPLSDNMVNETPKVFIAGETEQPPNLNQLMNTNGSKFARADEIPLIRAEAIKEAAASLGARGGLARKLHEISEILNAKKDVLDRQFDFAKLTLSIAMEKGKPLTHPDPKNGNGEYAMILPPVVVTGVDADSFPNEDEMRIADRTYKIINKAKIVPVDKQTKLPVVPNWRNYLIFSFTEIQKPHESLLPRNESEKRLWDEWVKKGWDDGYKLGDRMFKDGYAKLRRDFAGMEEYHLAYSEGKISRPQVAQLFMGITGGGTELRENDRVVRITDHSSFETNSDKWINSAKPIIK